MLPKTFRDGKVKRNHEVKTSDTQEAHKTNSPTKG